MSEQGEEECKRCKGSGECMLECNDSMDPQDAYSMAGTCPDCNGTGLAAQPMAQTAMETTHHPDDLAVDLFATAMKAKLEYSRNKHGRGGWNDKSDCSAEHLSEQLRGHVAKGDPVDVANFACFLWNRQERITPQVAQTGVPEGWRSMDSAPTDGTVVLLLIDPDTADHLLTSEQDGPQVSIGSFGVEGGAEHDPTWHFAGWDWEQDEYRRGEGKPIGWLPHDSIAAAPTPSKQSKEGET